MESKQTKPKMVTYIRMLGVAELPGVIARRTGRFVRGTMSWINNQGRTGLCLEVALRDETWRDCVRRAREFREV